MEYYRPPGGVDGLFRQYDRIVSHGGHSTGRKLQEPSVEPGETKTPSQPPPPQPSPDQPDAPPWQAPEEDLNANANQSTSLGGLVAGATAAAAATAKQAEPPFPN